LIPNGLIYLKAYIQQPYVNKETGKQGDPRLKFTSIQLLHDILDSQAKKITIHLRLDDLQEEQVNTLRNVLQTHKGEHALDFCLFEHEEKIQLEMKSRKHKVKISQELLDELEKENFLFKHN
jgi:DNA polymerase-3 subunit alpha